MYYVGESLFARGVGARKKKFGDTAMATNVCDSRGHRWGTVLRRMRESGKDGGFASGRHIIDSIAQCESGFERGSSYSTRCNLKPSAVSNQVHQNWSSARFQSRIADAACLTSNPVSLHDRDWGLSTHSR